MDPILACLSLQVLKPFLLRRIKTDVETSLPAKVEMILWAGMTETQRKFNDQLRDKTLPVSSLDFGSLAADQFNKPCDCTP